MSILAIETSASACSLAVRAGGKIHARHEVAPMQQAALILPLIEALLHAAEMPLTDLQAVAYGQGPGSFTGLRIAASVAGGLALALQIPVIPVCSLATLASHAITQNPTRQNRVVAVDARMGEIYWAAFQVDATQTLRSFIAPSVCRPEALSLPLSVPSAASWYGVGNAWQVYGSQMGFVPPVISPDANPRAEAMLSLAEAVYQAGGAVAPKEAGLVYLRNNVTYRQSALDSPPSER